MSTNEKLQAGAAMPKLDLPKVGGGKVVVGGEGRWQLVVVYRGKHCPLCRRYLKTLDNLLEDFRAIETEVVAVSGDPKEKAESEVAEEGWRFPVAYDLSPEQMRTFGLYISEPRSPQETDRLFPEPGLFVINPEGLAQIIDVSNAPFARPDLQAVLNGLKFIRERGYPIRGTAT
jgi:peroxiredoxin